MPVKSKSQERKIRQRLAKKGRIKNCNAPEVCQASAIKINGKPHKTVSGASIGIANHHLLKMIMESRLRGKINL